jgi:cytoskeletal protein CcmA (bactofilin family)
MRAILVLALSFALSGYTCAARFGPDIGPSFPDHDGDIWCTRTLSGSFDDVTVPVGASCALEHATIHGNIKVLEDAQLYVSGSRVHGNIQGDRARVVQVAGGQVDGDIQIFGGVSPSAAGAVIDGTVVTSGNIQVQRMQTGRILIRDAFVHTGNIQVTENVVGERLEIVHNVVGANLQVFANSGTGEKTVAGNDVSQILQCAENSPPFTGSPNTAGATEGQCR